MRANGYYWVRCKELWFVAEWDGSDWNTTQSSGVQDDELEEIDERRIEREEKPCWCKLDAEALKNSLPR